jgi:ABC-type antimicrobial peptide transport system permease subunit
MRLVGATNWFIRWPFVIEGVILGAMGGVLAVLLLLVGKVALIDPLAADFSLIAAPDTIDFRLLGFMLLAPPSASPRRARGCRCAVSSALAAPPTLSRVRFAAALVAVVASLRGACGSAATATCSRRGCRTP